MAKQTRLQQTLTELFDSQPDDRRLRDHLEGLTRDAQFPGLTWFWGPTLYTRNKPVFRSLILQYFSDWHVTGRKWKRLKWADHADRLEEWLAAARNGRDTRLVRRLLRWKHAGKGWGLDLKAWNAALLSEYRAAASPAARAIVLDEYDDWFDLDESTALELYKTDRSSSAFLLRHLPHTYWGGEKRALWKQLSQTALAAGDEDLHYALYRKQIAVKEWQAEVLALADRVRDIDELNAELERRHPEGFGLQLGDTAIKLLQARGRDAMPYVRSKLEYMVGNWYGDKSGPMIRLAEEKEWWDLWSATIRMSRDAKQLNKAVDKLLSEERMSDKVRVERLAALAGVSREFNWGGFGFAQVHSLDDKLATRLYRQYPDIVRGPFKPNITPMWWQGFPKLLHAAQAEGDDDLVDLLASRYATQIRYDHAYYASKERDKISDTAEELGTYYQAIRDSDPEEFARRAANVLTRIPAFVVYSYPQLLKTNQLARLLFVRSFDAYLAVPEAVRDLVEGSEIHVQMLAYRVLAQDDPRAHQIAVDTLDILLGTLLRPLHRKTRIAAFGALLSAAKGDGAAAKTVVAKARQSLRLPDTRYPKEQLIGLIGAILHLRPELRGEGEQPVVYGLEEAVA